MNDTNIEGNISTIAVWAYVILAPYIAQYVSQEVFIALVGIIIAIWSSANPNTFKFLKNDIKPCECSCGAEETVLNDEYTTDIDGEEGC